MAYNSDGYIMLDFTEVDFRRTNQTIEGLFDRCQKVIGTNKFVIVINANNKTPLPSTVCITNGQYVIESVLYTFAISSNDNLHITKKTTPEELLDDNHVTLKTTFSSNKIMSLIEGVIKTFTYTGNSTSVVQNRRTIQFPSNWNVILSITGTNRYNNEIHTTLLDYPIYKGMDNPKSTYSIIDINNAAGSNSRKYGTVISETDDSITIQSSTAFNNMNYEGLIYYVMYI